MSNELKGADFRALRRLSTADDETLAEIGDTCERVPAESLEGLIGHGYIEPAGDRAVRETPDPVDDAPDETVF
jgi:hypothetical protein